MPDATENTPKKDPTAQEAMFFYTMIKYMKNKADVDWDKVAAEVGFKNAGVARVRFGQIKRKLGLDGSDSPSKATPRSEGDVPSVPTTPTKIRKPRGSGAARGKAAAKSGGGGAARRARSKTATLEPEDHLTLEKDDEDDLGMPLYGVKKEEELEDGSLL
ncbi:hypothetical protein K4F52_002526 [Lecanicillium sp. MT-2017a]|nr:hypothetical protein K4F52_002526 [Lecanicillium sp. MT-2017a]